VNLDSLFVFTHICFVGSSCYIYVSCIYLRILVPDIRWCLFRLTVTRLVQTGGAGKLLTLPEHMSSPTDCFGGFTFITAMKEAKMWNRNCFPFQNTFVLFVRGSCSSILSFLCSVLYVLLPLVIVLYVFRFMFSDYAIGIFKLFLVWIVTLCRKISCIQSKAFLNKIFYICVIGLPSSTTNWTKSQSNCKTPNSKENNATDICKLYTDTTETGIWTNIFRVEISAQVDHGNTFYNNKQIYLFILKSLHLIYKYTLRIHFCFFRKVYISKPRPLRIYFLWSLLSGVGGTQNQCWRPFLVNS
jgi:hypothetical protein